MDFKWILWVWCFFVPGFVFAQNPKEIEQIRKKSAEICSAAVSDASGSTYNVAILGSPPIINSETGTYSSIDNSNVFVSKSDASGNILWKKELRGITTYEYCEPAAVLDDSGNVYISYNRISSVDGWCSFVVMLNASGEIVWTECLNNSDAAGINARAITIDEKGMLCITGCYWGKIDFNTSKGRSRLVSENHTGVFACKMNKEGKCIWIRGMERTDSEVITNEPLSTTQLEAATAIISH
ncbi:MAG: hypothetical protein WAQ28_08315 [Bacteroidia bacterium]|jgi:hypothetical protein